MEEMFKEVAKQSPSLAGTILIVWLCLKALDRRDVFIKSMFDQNNAARERMAHVMEENTKATATQTEALRHFSDTVSRHR